MIPSADVTLEFIRLLLCSWLGVETSSVPTASSVERDLERTSFPHGKIAMTNEELRLWEKAKYPPLLAWLNKHRKGKK